MDWIDLVNQTFDRDMWSTNVNTIMNLQFHILQDIS